MLEVDGITGEGDEAVGARVVERQSAGLRRELGVRDLVLMQILHVVGASWVGAAAKLGRTQASFWLLAMALFYLPQAAVVIHLNRRMPLEGGIYQWAKLTLGERWGFLVAWNLWIFTVVLLSAFGLGAATTLAYVIGLTGGLAASKPYTVTVIVVLTVGMMVVATAGLKVGKHVHNLGGITQILVFGALVSAPFLARPHGAPPTSATLALAVPTLSVLSLNILGKMGMGALSGFEWVAILAGETRSPAKNITRSVFIASPLIAIMFVMGTSAVLTYVHGNNIDLIAPIPQTLNLAYGAFGFAARLAPALVMLMVIRQVTGANLIFTGNTRLPMVAGWDGLLPAWFTRLHPRYRTPLNSIIFAGAITLVLGLASLIGVGRQESFQVLDSAAGVFYALTYLVMFALPLLPASRTGVAVPLWLRAASASGFAMTALYVAMSVVPIVDVVSPWAFAAKISFVIVGGNVTGLALYAAGRRRAAARRELAPAVGGEAVG